MPALKGLLDENFHTERDTALASITIRLRREASGGWQGVSMATGRRNMGFSIGRAQYRLSVAEPSMRPTSPCRIHTPFSRQFTWLFVSGIYPSPPRSFPLLCPVLRICIRSSKMLMLLRVRLRVDENARIVSFPKNFKDIPRVICN